MSTPERPQPQPPAPVEEPWRNLPLLVALVIAGLEAVVLVVAAVWSVITLIGQGGSAIAVGVALSIVLALFAALLLVGINALWQGRRWGRGPVLTWQLIQAAVAVSVLGMAPGWAVYPTLGASLVVGIGLLLPSSIAATGRAGEDGSAVL